jgi:hypothetical protein
VRGLRDNSSRQALSSAIAVTSFDAIKSLTEANPASPEFQGKLGTKWREWSSRSAFVTLRVARAADDLKLQYTNPEAYKEFFESRLHEQLSFSSIPDSRFDPAELAFSLEGLLLCAREKVDPFLFKRVLTVLSENQETGAYWRPNRPFMSKPTGEIALPISVEGANSLLCSVEIMDRGKLHETFAGIAVPMFRRFLQWLRARKVEVNALGSTFTGWHSEHINETGAIHLWDTSQVAEFLLAFRKLLKRHIAAETLVLSRVGFQEAGAKVEDWNEITKKYEPISNPKIATRIFDQIGGDFVTPWERRSSNNYSMLIYGPPGTGKTNLAQNVADALRFRLVTVTISDFLGSGGALVEARAKAIFQMLEAQSDSVIFFDEIDAFLLDRNSKYYRRQDTLFQFLTPGMLTKINNLRKAERSIFIIATNYENRIDPAIKRPGRIDQKYLLLPPDLTRRKLIISDILSKRRPSTATQPNDVDLDKMAKASVYLCYKEIEGALLRSAARPLSEISDALQNEPPSSSPQQYLSRLREEKDSVFPDEEFIALARMGAEAGRLNEIISRVNGLSEDDGKIWRKIVARNRSLENDPDMKPLAEAGS